MLILSHKKCFKNSKLTEEKIINNIPVYVFEKHHHVLEAGCNSYSSKPTLITFDNHSDTNRGF
jgi:hypothetical protein